MMRNELFGRLLYLIVNACFAKVRRSLKTLPRVFTSTRHTSKISGHRCGSGSVARPFCSTLEESTLDARLRVSCG